MRFFWWLATYACWYYIWDSAGWWTWAVILASTVCAFIMSTGDLIVVALLEDWD